MKRLNIRTGLKQRMNEILGTDSGIEGDVPGLTAWSIQAAMIDNIRRINAALVGDVQGRPMRGLWLTKNSLLSIAISAGYGITPTGDMVVIATGITSAIDSANGTKYIYLRHKMAEIDGDIYTDGKETGFIGKAGTQNIVYDDFAASKKDTVQSFVSEIITISPTAISGDPDLIYIGSVEVLSADITEVTNSIARGLGPNTPFGELRTPGIDCYGHSNFRDQVDFHEPVTVDSTLRATGEARFDNGISANGDLGVTDAAVQVGDGAGGSKLIKFKNGLYIGPV